MNYEQMKMECLQMAIALGANTPEEALSIAKRLMEWVAN